MRKTALLLLATLLSLLTFASNSGEKINFGFSLGTNYSMIVSDHTVIKSAAKTSTPGFNVGLLMNYKLSKNLVFSPKLDVAFNAITIISDGPNKDYNVMNTSVDPMLHFKYNFQAKNTSPYLVFGPGYRQPILQPKTTNEGFTTSPDLFIDFGIGMEKSFNYFFWAPELTYSFGLRNVNKNATLPSFNLHKLTLCFNFY